MILQFPQDDDRVTVLFRLSAQIWADCVHLVGDFNGWSTSATPMRRGEHFWEAQMTLEPGQRYHYAYLLDRLDWCTDFAPAALEIGASALPCTLLPADATMAQRTATVR